MTKSIFRNLGFVLALLFCFHTSYSQPTQTYCVGGAGQGNCNQPGPSNSPGNTINDFINSFNTSGGNLDICNNNSGCNGQANNYIYYNTSNLLSASPGQTITANIQSGIIFAQGFAIFIDWNNNGVFDMPSEQVAGTIGVPAAGTWAVLTFVIPSNQPLGTYRMRVRSSFATSGLPGPNGGGITPCGQQGYSETEDYDVNVISGGTIPTPQGFTLTTNAPICEGQTLNINISTDGSVTPTTSWQGPNSFASNAFNVSISSASVNMSGVYTASIGNTGCPITKTISAQVISYPVIVVTPLSSTVCQGGSVLSSISSNNPNIYTYQWSGPVNFASPNVPTSLITVNPITTNTALVVYSVVVTPTILNCPLTTTMSILINNPPTPTLTMPAPFCNNSPVTSASANPAGGAWYNNYLVGPTGQIVPNLATQFGIFPVTYSITIGTCSAMAVGNISVSRFNTSALTSNIPDKCVSDRPTNLLSIVQNASGVWAGPNVSANTFTPLGLPSNTYQLTYYNPSTPFANVCPTSNTINVIVINPPTPIITPITPKCTNAPTVTLLASPSGGVWSNNSGVTAGGIQFPALSNNIVGINTVSYTVGQGTCVAGNTATFHISTFHSANLLTNALNICVTTNPIDLMNLVASTVTGVWTPSAMVSGTFSFDPANRPTGTYVLNYNTTSTPDAALCPDSRTLTISLLNPTQPTIGLAGPFCSTGQPFQLSVNPATGSFVPSPYLTANGLFNPAFATTGNNGVQYIIGTNTCNISDTKFINVEAFVSPGVVGTIPNLCITGNPVSLLPFSTNTVGFWSGPGVNNTNFNPTSAGAGYFTLYYTTSSSPSGLCPAQGSIAVTVYSLAPPAIAQETPVCNSSQPFTLRATPTGGVFGIGPAIDPMGVFNPAFGVIGDNLISYSVMAGPCVAYTSSIVKVEKFISADFSRIVDPFCKNDPGIDLDTYVQNPGGTWSGPGLTGSYFNPSNANVGNGNIVRYITQSETIGTCPDTSDIRIFIDDAPAVSIVRDVAKGCLPVEVLFNTPSVNTGTGTWYLGDGSDPIKGLSVSHTYTAPGTYSVVFNYLTDVGCKSQGILEGAVIAWEVPKAAFTYNPYKEVTIADPQVNLINRTPELGKTTYQWQIADMYSLTDVNPVVIFQGLGEYRITLTATNIHGCKSEATDLIVVKPEYSIYVPNSFTPNDDGLNDTFLPVFSDYGLDSKTFDMEIFDRWGHSLYHTKDNTKGWDGSIQNKGSDPLKEETYLYKIKYRDITGKLFNKVGYVTLVK